MSWEALMVGEKFPAQYHKYDSAGLALDGSTFNLILSVGTPSPKEVKAFGQGTLRVGAVAIQAVPLVLLDCPGLGTFDAALNILLESPEKREAFLAGEPEANLVQLFLVDNRTDLIRGMRAVGLTVEIMSLIKAAAFDQVAAYPSAAAVSAKIQEIMAGHSTDRLISLAKMMTFKR